VLSDHLRIRSARIESEKLMAAFSREGTLVSALRWLDYTFRSKL